MYRNAECVFIMVNCQLLVVNYQIVCHFDYNIVFLRQIDICIEGRFLLVNVNLQLLTNVILTKIKLSFNLIKDSSAS
jgi:hypothetical protein